MATGRKTVVVGQVIDPNAWGNLLWDQSVQTFTSAADRTAQFPAPLQGALTWLEDVKRLDVYNGTAWLPYGAELLATTFGAGIVAFSPDFAAGQLIRVGKVVSFRGAVTFPAGVLSGAPVWTFPAGWAPAAGQGVHLSGWLGTGPARYQALPTVGNITYQAGGVNSAGAFGFASGEWICP